MQNLFHYYISVFLPRCKSAEHRRVHCKPLTPVQALQQQQSVPGTCPDLSWNELSAHCKGDESNPLSWELHNELRTCQIKVLQKPCLLTDLNTEYINTQELCPQRQLGARMHRRTPAHCGQAQGHQFQELCWSPFR